MQYESQYDKTNASAITGTTRTSKTGGAISTVTNVQTDSRADHFWGGQPSLSTHLPTHLSSLAQGACGVYHVVNWFRGVVQQIDGQTDKQAQIDGRMDRRSERQADRQTETEDRKA